MASIIHFLYLLRYFRLGGRTVTRTIREVVEVAEDENGTKGETMAWLCV